MQQFSSLGFILLIAGALVVSLVLISARLASRRRDELVGSEDPVIPLNLASVSDAVLVASIGGQVNFANEAARQWFSLDTSSPDLWLLASRVKPAEAFLELFATEGQASFTVGERAVQASSHRVSVGDSPQFIVVMREQVPLPVLDKEERGSARALQVLSEVTAQITASLELEDTLDATLQGIERMISCEAAQITLLDSRKEMLRPAARRGPAVYVDAMRREDSGYRMDEGFPGWIARKRQALLVHDTSRFEEVPLRERPGEPRYLSVMGVPLMVSNRFIGTLELLGGTPERFDREDMAVLQLLAGQAAIAIENARQYRSQSARVSELSGLQRIAEAISDLRDTRQLYAQLGARIAELMNVEMAGVLLMDEVGDRLLAQRPLHGVLDVFTQRYEISMARGTTARALWEDVDYWFSNDVLNDRIVDEMGLRELAELTGVRQTAMALMQVGEQHIGVLQISNKLDGSPLTLDDIRLLQIYANQAAIIVESARLYSEEQSRVSELEGLQAITQAISAFKDPEQLFAQLTERIARLMQVEICGILLYDPDEDHLIANTPFYGVGDEVARGYNISITRRGLARDLWRDQDVFLSNNVFTDDRIDEFGIRDVARAAGLQTLLLAPLNAGGRRFGMLQISNKLDGSDFDEDDRRLLTIFAGQSAALIENARLYQDTDATLRKRAAELRSVSRINRELNATLELERILEVIAVEAQRAEGATHGTLVMFEWDEARSETIPLMRFGVDVGTEARILETAAARSGETVIIEDFERVPHYPSPLPGLRCALITPMFFEGKVVGAISLYGKKPGALGQSAAEYVQALSSQATIAITNATRHAEQMERSEIIRRRAEQLTKIFELGREFRSDKSAEENLESVARIVRESAGFERVLVAVIDHRSKDQKLRLAAHIGLEEGLSENWQTEAPIWGAVGQHLNESNRTSLSHLVAYNDSRELFKALHVERPSGLSFPERSGRWSPGDLLCLPLRSSGGELLGLMAVDTPRDGMRPSRDGIELLEIFANQAAVGIENSRLYSDVEERAQELSASLANLEKSYGELDKLSQEMIRKDVELSRANDLLNVRAQRLLALHRIMESVDTTAQPDDVLREIAGSVAREMDVDQVLILAGPGDLRLLAAGGRIKDKAALEGVFSGRDPVSEAYRHHRPMLYRISGSRETAARRLADALGAESYAAIPLNLGPDRGGVLVLGSAQPGADYDEDDRDQFILLASQIEVEYENARLYQEVQREAASAAAERDRLQQLHLVTTAFQQTSALKERLRVIARGIRSVGWGKSIVMLFGGQKELLDLATAGYSPEEEAGLRKELPDGAEWQRRFMDPVMNRFMVGTSYFVPAAFDWREDGDLKAQGPPATTARLAEPAWEEGDRLYLPMYAGTQMIGVICLAAPASGQRPEEAQLRPLELFAQQAASTLENARLYQESSDLQAFTNAVLESIQQGIVVTDREKRIESLNTFMRDIYGWSEELVGQPIAKAREELPGIGLEAALDKVIAEGEPAEILGVRLKVADEERALNLFVYPRREGETLAGAVLLIEDVTARARLEADIALRARQLAALNEASAEIAAALSAEGVAEAALHSAPKALEYDRVALWRHRSGSDQLELLGADGYKTEDKLAGMEISFANNKLFEQISIERSPLLLGDARKDQRVPLLDGKHPGSWLGAPMLSGGNLVGVLVLEREVPNGYSSADIQIVAAFANQLAVGLENARLFEESEERAEELASRSSRLALLNRVSAQLGQSLDQTSILQSVIDELAQALQAPHGSVLLFDVDVDLGNLSAVYPSSPDGSVPPHSFTISACPALVTMRQTRTPMMIEMVEGNDRLGELEAIYRALEARSALLIPLVVGNAVNGVLSVERRDEQGRFNEDQIELAQTLVNQAAVSVQNARLFQETVTRQRELSLLSEAGRLASSSLDLDTVVGTAARYLMSALEVAGCTISLWDKAADTMLTLRESTMESEREVGPQDHRGPLKDYRVMAQALEARGSLVVEASNNQLTKAEKAWLSARRIAQVLMLPLVARDEIVGLIELWETNPTHRFSQRQIRLAASLAAQVATAMENARLHDETQNRLEELGRINQISRALTGAISADDLFATLIEQVRELLGANSLTIARRGRREMLTFPLAVRDGKRIHIDPVPLGKDIYSAVMESAEPLLISRNVKSALDERRLIHIEKGLKSLLAVPLMSGEGVVGVLSMEDYRQEGTLNDSALRLIGPVAAQVAVSLENTRLYAELQQRLGETTTLQQVSRVVNSALDLEEIFARVVSELASNFRYPLVGLYTVEGQELLLRASHGFRAAEKKRFSRLPLNEGVVGRAARQGEPQFVDDPRNDPDYQRMAEWATAQLAIPIIADGKTLGVLSIESGEDIPLEQGALPLLTTFADQVATAMTNARLYNEMVKLSAELEQRVNERTAQLQDERDRIDTLYRIAVELTASLDLDRVLNRALELVGEAVGAEHGSLYLVDPQSDKLIHRAVMAGSVVLPPGGRQITLSRHEGMAGWVMDNVQSVVIENVQVDPRWANVPGTEHNRGLLGAPLVANHEVLGCLFFTSNREGAFNQEHVRLVEAAAQQVANSINNAELYRMIRDQAERLGIMLRSQQTEAAKSQAILESVADGVMVSDQAGEIILFNAAAERILGLRRDEVLGRPSKDLAGLYGPNAERWTRAISALSADPRQEQGEVVAEQIELGDRVVSVSVSPVINGMEYLGLVYVIRDITREVLADRVKTQFVANVSHELRTPLTVIKGYADLLLLGRAGDISGPTRDYIERVKRHADRLSVLVNDLLDISLIEQGTVELTLREVDLRELISEVINIMRIRMENEARDVNYITEFPEDLPSIEADQGRMLQVMTNLLANGYQYTEDGGSVTIRARMENEGVHMDVIDTGIGIPDSDRPHVFDRFFRGEHPLIMRAAGTGLGLSIVNTLITMHHGWVTFESETGKGTTFSLWLPLRQPEPEEES